MENYSFSPVLFTDETGDSLLFVIKPCKEKGALRDMIKYGGGEVVSTPGDHGITLIPPKVDFEGSDEVYSTEYIKDCCTRNKLQDLKRYRMNAVSQFPDSFDVMDVLLKYTSWSAALKGLPFERKLYPVNSPPSDSSSCSDDIDESELLCPTSSLEIQTHCQKTEKTIRTGSRGSETEFEKSEDSQELKEVFPKAEDGKTELSEDRIGRTGDEAPNTSSSKQHQSYHRSSDIISSTETQTEKASSSNPEGEIVSDDDEAWNLPTKRARRGLTLRRRDYTRKEKLAVINFITKHRCHNYVKGRELWQKAEAAKICPGRTWQSLKEHFIKKIIPNIKLYDLSEEELRKFQKPFR